MTENNNSLSTQEKENLYLCFLLDENIYSLNAINVLEVATLPMLHSPQKLANFVVGILNYNDLFINVLDIRKILNRPTQKYNLSNKIIIIKGEESLFAIIADKVTDFFPIKQQDTQRIMGEANNDIIKTFCKKNENTINIIDIEALESFVKNTQTTSQTNYEDLFPQDEESLFVLQKRSKELAKIPFMNISTNIYEKNQYIIFTIENHKYCLRSEYAKEFINLKNYPITKIPFTPSYIVGIINLKGNFYSVLNLKEFMGLNREDDNNNNETNKVLVLDASELKLALVVDEIVDIINIAQENITEKNDKNLDSLFIKAEAYINNEVYNILNIEKLINDDRLYIDNNI